jgi:pyridoxal phosphate enzyme (YggS family)
MTEPQSDIVENIRTVRERMQSVLQGNRNATLVAVSKYKPAEDIMAAYEGANQKHFGENYVQELVDKSEKLPRDIAWHFIGNLQSNKCKVVAAIPNLYAVETIESSKKADSLNKACVQVSRESPLNVFVQINTSGEESKSGADPSTSLEIAKHIVENCSYLKLFGLMTIGAPDRDTNEGENPDFVCLRECKSKIEQAIPGLSLELSMGMSADYQEALASGSTNIRVGSTIFGSRPPKQ